MPLFLYINIFYNVIVKIFTFYIEITYWGTFLREVQFKSITGFTVGLFVDKFTISILYSLLMAFIVT